jgi:predicted Holliday junction resolvase-like endonuclease
VALSLIILFVVVVLITGGVYLFRQQIKDFCILQKNKWEQQRKEREAEQERLRQEKIRREAEEKELRRKQKEQADI